MTFALGGKHLLVGRAEIGLSRWCSSSFRVPQTPAITTAFSKDGIGSHLCIQLAQLQHLAGWEMVDKVQPCRTVPVPHGKAPVKPFLATIIGPCPKSAVSLH